MLNREHFLKFLQPLQGTYFCRLLAIVFSQAALFTPSSISYFFWSWMEVLHITFFSQMDGKRKERLKGMPILKRKSDKTVQLISSQHLKPARLHFSYCHFIIFIHNFSLCKKLKIIFLEIRDASSLLGTPTFLWVK